MRDIILLHGALGCNAHWNHVLPHLEKSYRYHNLNFPLHGGTEATHKELTMDDLQRFVVIYADTHLLESFDIVGYSMGGYVGLDLAIQRFPGLDSVITLGTKLDWSESAAEREISKLTIEGLEPIHAKLEMEHGPQWKDVVSATHSIMRGIGKYPLQKEDFSSIEVPVTLLLGERDKMVTAEETADFAEQGPMCSYEIIPGQPHLLEKTDGALIAEKINAILARNPPREKHWHL